MKNLESAIIYNLSSLPIITEYIEHDLNAFRNVFGQTKIITFDYDVWANTSDTVFISTPDHKSIVASILEIEKKLDNVDIVLSTNIVFGTTINEEYENLIKDVLERCNFYSTYGQILDAARESTFYDSKLEYSLGNVICSHVTFHFFVRWFNDSFQQKTILRVLNDSVEIPMTWLQCKQAYVVDSHAQTKTKWVDKVYHYPVVHFSTLAFADKIVRKRYKFSFGMSNYTGSELTERSKIEKTMHELTELDKKCNFYVSGNVYGIRTKIPYNEYLDKVAASYCTMIIPSYDVNAFSVRRISEAIHNETVLLFWSTSDIERLFSEPCNKDFLNVYETYNLLLPENPTAYDILTVLHFAKAYHSDIIKELKETNIFKNWYDMSWYNEQMLTIITETNA